MFVRKLAISNFSHRKIRAALTVAAVAMSVSLVVAVTSGYSSAAGAAHKYLNQFMGSIDASVEQKGENGKGVPGDLIVQIAADPAVKRADGRLETDTAVLDKDGKGGGWGSRGEAIGIRLPGDTRIQSLRLESGEWFDSDDGNVAVIDQVTATRLKVAIGDNIILPSVDRKLVLKVVGVVHKPEFLAQQSRTIYVPLKTLQRFVQPEAPDYVSRVMIDFKEGPKAEEFASRWRQKLAAIDPTLRVRLAGENRDQLDKNLQGINFLSYLGGVVSMVAATFIVFSALSMGVAERQRTLAMLRAVGAFKQQIGLLVVIEGLILAGVGVLLGIPIGWLAVKALSVRFHNIFTAGVVTNWGGIAVGGIGSMIAALLASFLPAWSAMRVSPLEAMTPLASPNAHRVPPWSVVLGLVCVALDPIIVFCPLEQLLRAAGVPTADEVARQVQFYAHFALGLPGIMVGFFLLGPLFVYIIERLFGLPVAGLFRLRYALLRQQLTSGIWRAAGTCAALMVGLAILVVMQTQGQTMLKGWRLPDKFPDVFMVSLLGLDQKETATLAATPGIRQGELMPIAIASPEFGSNLFAIAGTASMPNATMFFGLDPELANRMTEMDFRVGTAEEATRLMRLGHHLIVTEEFHQLKGLTVGSKLALRTTLNGVVEYTIAGVIFTPGLDVMVNVFDMSRQFDERTGASVFGTLEDARRDFGVERVNVFAANLDGSLPKEELTHRIAKTLWSRGVQVFDVRQVKFRIQEGFGRLLMVMSAVAFAAMAVASLGVTNTIMASIRSRRWQFGILRAIGVTRSQLMRLVIAEALLLGIIGVALGLAAGFLMSITAKRLSVRMLGYNPPMVVPWPYIFLGVGIVLVVALLASLWPATSTARSQPLSLLQAGRASA